MAIEVCVMVHGQKAVDLARQYIGNKCYSGVYVNGEWIAQAEVTVDDDGYYNGRPNKWVDFSYIKPENVEKVLSWLRENGFSGCFAVIRDEIMNGDLVMPVSEKEITL